MESRLFGRTGAHVRIFGFGGIVVRNMEQAEADRVVARAIDRGVNYFDVAPSYGDAQDKLGPALEPYRKNVLLACKTLERRKEKAAAELRDSLRKLRTDYFDVYQLHALDSEADIETAFGPGGAMEAIVAAREAGLIRFIGFSAHTQKAALALMDRFDFDTVMFPCNFAYWLRGGAGEAVMKRASERNMGRITLKALAHRPWLKGEEKTYPNCWYKPIYDNPELADLAVRFTLSQPVHVALSPGDHRMLWLGIDIADNFRPVTDAEIQALRARAQEHDYIFAAHS